MRTFAQNLHRPYRYSATYSQLTAIGPCMHYICKQTIIIIYSLVAIAEIKGPTTCKT